jgi:hypothetical protein
MKNTVQKLLSLSVIMAMFSVSTVFAEGGGADLIDLELTVSPDVIYSGFDITIDVVAEGGLDLLDVELPDLGDLSLNDWMVANPDEADAFQEEVNQEVEAGKTYATFLLVREFQEMDETEVLDLDLLVPDHAYVTVTDNGFSLTLPGGEDGIDLVSGNYTAWVIGHNLVEDEAYVGKVEFVVTDFLYWILDIELFDGFMLPGEDVDDAEVELLLPAVLQINPAVVVQGEEVTVNLFAEDVETLAYLPDGWEIEVWPFLSLFGNPPTLTTEDGSIATGDEGLSFTFMAPDFFNEQPYYVNLKNDEGETVWSEELIVNEEDEDVVDEDLGDIIDWGDIFGDLDLDDPLDDDEDGDEDEEVLVVESTDCADVALTHWGLEFINPLMEDGLYPVLIDGPVVNCRPDEGVLRKEFTAWLLAAYMPDVVAAIDEVDTSETGFSDVDSDDVYAPYIVKAAELEIINGNPDGTFAPDAQINRAEVLKILLRTSELFSETDEEMEALVDEHGLDLVNPDPAQRFTDVTEEDWYYKYTYYGVAKQIIQGYDDNTAKMGQGVLYSEAAKILYLAMELAE